MKRIAANVSEKQSEQLFRTKYGSIVCYTEREVPVTGTGLWGMVPKRIRWKEERTYEALTLFDALNKLLEWGYHPNHAESLIREPFE